MEKKEFRSIHIDLKKREFRLNDIPMGSVSALELTFENGKWSLSITKDELYEGITTTKTTV